MKLTRASSYALAALVHLARQKTAGLVASYGIAEAEGIPEQYLLRTLTRLVDASVLPSLKGPTGGYALTRAPKDVTLLEVVEAVDGSIRGDAPAVGRDGTAAINQKLQAVCDDAAALVRERLARVTLAELARGK